MNHRVIARLDIKGPNLVKGIHLEGLRVLGSPEEFARHYYQSGADELLYMDVVASLYERNSLKDFITKTAKEVFIPLTIGGGLRSIEDINMVLRAGADKVCLNTAAINNPKIINDASLKFGASTIVVAIEAIKQQNGEYLAYTDNGREFTGKNVFEWAKEVRDLGAGEIVLTSIDREGTGEGFDIELIKEVSELVDIPVIAHGGCGKAEHAVNAIKEGNATAVAISSIFHYDFVNQMSNQMSTNSSEGNTEFLKNKKFTQFNTASISDVKKAFKENNINCRQVS